MAKSTKNEPDVNEGEVRRTFIINGAYANKLNNIAYWERLKIKDVINAALGDYIKSYEKKNGPVKASPQ